ncbi:low molecular weight protein-tyrosine-phosphatase YfkJ [bacterium BMS3Abin03]|nr:low molecular weight protein-tyrosine-phosphatase YfkJ [bacterium BMS3Abin03]
MNKKRILFVCMGNICRSPAAEAVVKKMVEKEKLLHVIDVDSAGTIDYHSGEPADARMILSAKKRGYTIDSISRQFDMNKDFERFDYIITMDEENYEDIKSMDIDNKYQHKLYKIVSFCESCKGNEIPDPYYNGTEGFDLVLDLLEEASTLLLKQIKDDLHKENQNKN